MQEEESPRPTLLNEYKEQTNKEKDSRCKISYYMIIVIVIATAIVLAAIIVPLTIKEEKGISFMTFCLNKFIEIFRIS